MDTSTNHLVTADRLVSIPEPKRRLYRPVPPHLQTYAEKELAGRQECTVPKRGLGALSQWARDQRAASRKKAVKSDRRRRMERAARKRGRR